MTDYNKNYYWNNRDEELERNKEWCAKNPEKKKALKKKSYEKNKDNSNTRRRLKRQIDGDKIRETEKARRAKIKLDPILNLRNSVSKTINKLLKRVGVSKAGESILQYLPYTFEELKIHLEKQFEFWMTWENRGKYNAKLWNDNDPNTWTWHMDHIIPQSDLSYTSMSDPNFRKTWALDNLRPLSAKQNILDGVNRTRHQAGSSAGK